MITFRLVEWLDRDVLWDWYCEPLRHIAFGASRSITYERHCAWLRKAMKDQNKLLMIGLLDNLRISVVRFDQVSEAEYEVTVYLKPTYCGREYLPCVLQAAADYLQQLKPVRKLRATLGRENQALVRNFLAAGYVIEQTGSKDVRMGRVVGL